MAVTIKDITTQSSGGSNATSATITAPATIANGDSAIIIFERAHSAVSSCATSGVTRIFGLAGGSSTQPHVEVYTKHNLLASDAGGTLAVITWGTTRPWRVHIIRTEALKTNDATFTVSAGTNAGGDLTLLAPNVVATAAGLGVTVLAGSHGNPRTFSAGTEQGDVDISTSATNSARIHVGTYDIAAAGSVAPPTSTRDGGSTTAGSWPRVNVSFVAASTNALPTVSAIKRDVAGDVGKAVTFGVTASDPDGTIASYAAAQVTAGSSITAPSLTNNGDGTFTFTPTVPGAYTWSLTATDNVGGVSAAQLISVIVTAPAAMKTRSGGVFVQHKATVRTAGVWG